MCYIFCENDNLKKKMHCHTSPQIQGKDSPNRPSAKFKHTKILNGSVETFDLIQNFKRSLRTGGEATQRPCRIALFLIASGSLSNRGDLDLFETEVDSHNRNTSLRDSAHKNSLD